jgi:lysozyme
MILSDDGLEAIKQREGVRLTMYRDSAGLPTIGTGHLLTKDELSSGKLSVSKTDWHQGISQDVADQVLRYDVLSAEDAVARLVVVPLVQYQYDALVSFTFNVGNRAFGDSTLLRLLNAGDYLSVPGQLRRWTHSAGQVDPILATRRESEVRQWENT